MDEGKLKVSATRNAVTVTRKRKVVTAAKKDFWDYFIMQAGIALVIMLVLFVVGVLSFGLEPLKEAFPLSLTDGIFTSKIV